MSLYDVPLFSPELAFKIYFDGIARLLEVRGGYVSLGGRVAAFDDPVRGWRPVHIGYIGADAAWRESAVDEWFSDMDAAVINDPAAHYLASREGERFACRRRDFMGDPADDMSPGGLLMKTLGVSDRLMATLPLSGRAILHVGFDRDERQPCFDDEELVLVQTSLSGLFGWGRSVALMYGLVGASGMLTTRERQVLAALLQGKSERQAAEAIGISPRNCHQRVVRIYRQLGVTSRGQLLALWLDTSSAVKSGRL